MKVRREGTIIDTQIYRKFHSTTTISDLTPLPNTFQMVDFPKIYVNSKRIQASTNFYECAYETEMADAVVR
ncbi:hypothetical protein KIN20_004463 [Parelaphostrongylus tenuis]|uniref:Uncharacterized protein n=1 Tax=Parelaphostrongylus tenuis TaxID=148309 RepID=A0AAD5MJT2_PARTN|nr:hypothetical protein KIN20_004463 [Parelaphostrongylus tenuis]